MLIELDEQAVSGLTFPCTVLQFQCISGKDLKVSYPCVVLNVMVAEHNTNDQYQTLVRISQFVPSTSSIRVG